MVSSLHSRLFALCCALPLLCQAATAQINLSQGQPIGVGANSALVSTNNGRVCDPKIGFLGADNALQIQTCINDLGAVASGAVDASGFTGSFTVNNTIIPTTMSPSAVRVSLGGASITTNVPQLLQSRVELVGIGAQGASGQGMTFFVAGPSFPAGCGANDSVNVACTGSVTTTVTTAGCTGGQVKVNGGSCQNVPTNFSIAGSSTKWSTGTQAQTLAPGCDIAVGTFTADGSINSGWWGIVEMGTLVADASVTLGTVTLVGTGTSGTSSYAKYCDLIVTSDGYTGGSPAFGVGLDHIGADCNGVDGCNAYGNYWSQEKTYIRFFQCRGYMNGFCIHNETAGAQNAGPFEWINGGPGSGATANTIDVYDAIGGGARTVWSNNTLTHAVTGACTNPPNVAVVLEDNGAQWSGNHQEICTSGTSVAVQVGQSSIVKAPVFFAQGPLNCHDCAVRNNSVGGNGAPTFIAVSSTAQYGITIENNTDIHGVTNMLTDASNTITASCNGGFLGHYWTDSFGKVFTDAKSTCLASQSASFLSNGSAFFQGGVAPPINALGNLPSCSSASEGLHVVANNCNAACSAGGTCSLTGTIHCELYCNSAGAYVETGR